MMTSTSKAEVGCVVDVRHIDSIDRGWIIFKVDYWKKYMNGMRETSVILKLIVSYYHEMPYSIVSLLTSYNWHNKFERKT